MKKVTAYLLAAVMAFSMLAGCGGKESSTGASTPAGETAPAGDGAAAEGEGSASAQDALAGLPENWLDGDVKATPEMYPNVDMSKPYTVYLYQVGDTPQDWDQVESAINEYLTPFNTTIETVFISWADVATMYSLVLAGGEQIDAIFTAPWEYMYTEAAKGSFYTYDREWVTQNMPLTDRYQMEKSFGQTKVNGQMVAMPSNREAAQNKIVAIRQDLADKYGIEKLENWDDYMNFCLTIAEKETPESGILAMAAAGNNAELWDVYRQQYDTFQLYNDNNMMYLYSYDGEAPAVEDIQLAWNTDYFLQFAKDMKTLADAGAWSRGALSNTTSDDDAFGALQGASIAWNGSVFTYMKTAEKNEGVACAAYDLTKDNLVACEECNNGDIAIAAASQDPLRTAMIIDILKMDTYVNRLVNLGIEGEHYTLGDKTEKGWLYTKTEKSANYPPDGCSLSWGVRNGAYEEDGAIPREKEMTDSWEPRLVSCPTVTFVFDDTAVADYAAACKTVLGDYIPSLQLGLVEDVEASLAEMNAKLETAGIKQVEEEMMRQYSEWLAAQ